MTLHEVAVTESMKILVLQTELDMMANGHGDHIHENYDVRTAPRDGVES